MGQAYNREDKSISYNPPPGSLSRQGRGRITTAVLGAGSQRSCDFRARKSYQAYQQDAITKIPLKLYEWHLAGTGI